MARVLFCDKCQKPTGAIVVEGKPKCATCLDAVAWREMDEQPLTLTFNDRRFLKMIRISPE